ncbi:superfamily I DNA/RNA helicase-like protein [Mycolicibacterium phlei RIVM601174]|nr:superfamily I DNA/RNA helicase-like protein [Mycolicibacterium phlei RIVM601174]MBF4193155.1 superfamily I DNA/RNA helicase-like protein [Mycolicibacterium phlei]
MGQAETLIGNLLDAGVYDADFARLKCLAILQDSEAFGWLHTRLSSRFEEIIVDEFQDCSAIEHAILRKMTEFGIRVVVVADPDQAIYEFRQAAPASYEGYRDALGPEEKVYLDENWRSSPAICTLLSSLRRVSNRPIISRRDGHLLPHADVVYVASGSAEFARNTFNRLASDLEIQDAERIALAATRSEARSLAGHAPSVAPATKLPSKVIRFVAVLRFSKDAAERKSAITALEAILLETIRFTDEQKKSSRDEQLAAAGIDKSQLRMMVGRLVTASYAWSSAETALESIRSTVSECLSGVRLGFTPVRQRFQRVTQADWHVWETAKQSAVEVSGLASAHIHSIKGGERDAVLLKIEEVPVGSRAHILDLWASGQTHEALRVLYVGASRARRLLVLAVSPNNLAALKDLLTSSNVPVEYIEEAESS